MTLKQPLNIMVRITTIALTSVLCACTKQAWYSGAQSSQTAHCMQEPESEYNDCIEQSNENYDSYSKTREQILKEKH